MKTKHYIIMGAIGISMIVVGFYAGMQYQKSQRPNFAGMQTRQGGARVGMRPVNGKVLAVDDVSITIELPEGGSKILILNDKTMIRKSEEASKSALVEGVAVSAFGTENSDGSITAQSVSLNPQLRFRMDQ